MTDAGPPPPSPPPPEQPPQRPSTRSQMARCQKHGRVYDASKEAGCTQCIAEGTTPDAVDAGTPLPPGRKQGLPQGVLLGLLVVLLGAIVVPPLLERGGEAPQAAAAAPADAAEDAAPGDASSLFPGTPRANRADPAQYQPEIRALETALYGSGDGSYEQVGRVSAAARELGSKALTRNRVSPIGRDLFAAMNMLVEMLDPDAGYSAPDFAQARGNWERIRTEFFTDAAWFHAPAPPPPPRAAPRPEDSTAFRQTRQFANDLDRIIINYRSTLLAFKEASEVVRGSAEARDLLTEYRIFFRRWNDELDNAQRLAPEGRYRMGEGSRSKVQTAGDILARAFTELRAAAPGNRVPTRFEREQHLAQARTYIQQGLAELR